MHGVRTIVMAAALLATLSLAGRAASQDQTPQGPLAPDEPVEATGVGIAGGVLLGAELILAVEAIIDVEPVWPWIVFPIVGAAGGGVGGYFVEQASPEGAIAMLVVGLVAIIPTAVAISVSRAYDPESEGAVEEASDRGRLSFELPPEIGDSDGEATTEVESRPDEIPDGAGEPPLEPEPEPPGGENQGLGPAAPSAASVRPVRDQRARHLGSGSLLHIDRGFGFGVPAPEIRTGPALGDGALLGLERDRGLEINVPILRIDLP
ncbi:MAG TPA: hypothetical protein VM285_03595 [Polyangia bacterium]|nr:hypothetical protein [Polyangia bacterium]